MSMLNKFGMSNKFLLNSWIGVGVKGGGFLGFFGGESTYGKLFNLYDSSYQAGFSLTNARIGLGLGGSAGVVLLMVFNCPNLWRINGDSSSDWGINFSMGNRWSEFLTAVKHHKMLPIITKLAKNLNNRHGIAHLEGTASCRNFMHYIYSSCELEDALRINKPKVISIDIPGSGKGFEISATYSFGAEFILEVN